MTGELKALPPPEKKVAAKILYQMGWGSRKVEEKLKASGNKPLENMRSHLVPYLNDKR